MCPEDHQDDAQQSSPPQHHLFLYIDWFVKLHSEPRIPETRENRTWANVDGQNGPRSRLQLHRNVTTTSTKWKMGNYWRHERSIWCKYWAMIWSHYWVRMCIHRKRSTSAQEVQHRISSRLRPRGWDGQSWETSQYTILHNFWYFLPVAQLERLMHCSGGFGPSKCLLSWVIPGSAVNCGCWEGCYNQIIYVDSSIATHRCWILFSPAKVCSKEWNNVYCSHFYWWESFRFSHDDK